MSEESKKVSRLHGENGWPELAEKAAALMTALKNRPYGSSRSHTWKQIADKLGISSGTAKSFATKPSISSLVIAIHQTKKLLNSSGLDDATRGDLSKAYIEVIDALIMFTVGDESKAREYVFARYLGVTEDQGGFASDHRGHYAIVKIDRIEQAATDQSSRVFISISSMTILDREIDSVVCHFQTSERGPIEVYTAVRDGYVYRKGDRIYAIGKKINGNLRYSVLTAYPASQDLAGVRLSPPDHASDKALAQRVIAISIGADEAKLAALKALMETNGETIEVGSEAFAPFQALIPRLGSYIERLKQEDAEVAPFGLRQV